ncbi:MAG: 2-succinyl-5-enolpyruvyl-6-hydroxy-3-cyclohexene-1-carboxylic-acid synthase [Kofleriaceae bacterium]|nr:2-succinyl-5-enolpyruvyl-6-hydroxy-3-cyclohexene-1-carboxylic-acid synthase [Kofleriaceae bacterium]
MSAAIQTMWTELIAATLADAGVATCVISPGSRSTPLVTALVADGRLELPNIIDERAAAFFALGVARATGVPAALVCTSGSATAHYLPALVEASLAGVPLVVLTADRPPELQQCGASQTIDQVDLYGAFVREAFDLGAPVGTAIAMRAVRRKLSQAISLARGPRPGPVHINVPLRKPLEPAQPSTDGERALARTVASLCHTPVTAPTPTLVAGDDAIDQLAAAIAAEPRGVVIAGAMPAKFAAAREAVFDLAIRAGYPLLAEASSQLRFGPRPPQLAAIDQFDLVLAAPTLAGAPAPRLIIQIGSEPVAAGWMAAQPSLADVPRYVLADHEWRDPDSSARAVIVGDVASSLARITARLSLVESRTSFAASWSSVDARVGGAVNRALASHPRSEGAVLRAALGAAPAHTVVQIGNSLPIRVVDLVVGGGAPHVVLSQRGAAGIDGLIASAAGASRAGKPVLLVLGDVSFAHDLGGLLAARESMTPLAIVVVDNGGGRIFNGLPIARTNPGAAFDKHFTTAPGIDPAAVALALGARAVSATSPAAVASAVTAALASTGPTVIHAPVTATGAQDVRRDALDLLATSSATTRPSSPHVIAGVS